MAAITRQHASPALDQQCPKLKPVIQELDRAEHRVDLQRIAAILRELRVTRDDLRAAIRFGADAYKRNTVKETSWYELVVLCWRSGQRTPIHDHVGSSCAFKIIEGVASETRFVRTPSGLICPTTTRRLETGFVCAAEDTDIHQVANAEDPEHELITLHIYSPPFKYYNRYSLESSKVERAARDDHWFDGGAGV